MRSVERQAALFDDPNELPANVILATLHYLGPADRGDFYRDEDGVMVFANPNSRRLPYDRWLELIRWCITGGPGAGTRQWAKAQRWLRERYPLVTTVVSYSDPSVGHTGALYRACNWRWAPTWHRLRTPPTGNGDWGNNKQAAKDRWVALLQPDPEREALLSVEDESLMRRIPWASYREPKWNGARATGGGGDYKRWLAYRA
jgi:hypothetical protein